MDDVDMATLRQADSDAARIDAVRQAAAYMEAGTAGICDLCGTWSGRLVRGACAPCRDRYKLP